MFVSIYQFLKEEYRGDEALSIPSSCDLNRELMPGLRGDAETRECEFFNEIATIDVISIMHEGVVHA